MCRPHCYPFDKGLVAQEFAKVGWRQSSQCSRVRQHQQRISLSLNFEQAVGDIVDAMRVRRIDQEVDLASETSGEPGLRSKRGQQERPHSVRRNLAAGIQPAGSAEYRRAGRNGLGSGTIGRIQNRNYVARLGSEEAEVLGKAEIVASGIGNRESGIEAAGNPAVEH